MPKKLTYEEVKEFIESNSGGECKLLSTEYENNVTPLLLQCKCGNIFTRTFAKIKLGRFKCKDCVSKDAHDRYALTYEEVKKNIEAKGCTLISENYYNSSQKLTIRCKCGNIFTRTYSKFSSGQVNCQECANRLVGLAKKKYDVDFVKEKLAERGYELVGEYKYSHIPVKCKCSRGHIFDLYFGEFLYRGRGCLQCSHIDNRGKNHHNYKGGESELIDFLRKNIGEWKLAVAKKYNYRCYITGRKTDFVIHHLDSFNLIVKDILESLGLEHKRKLRDYTEKQMEDIRALLKEKHPISNGIALNRAIHNDFHFQYGKGNNTREQFNEFLQKNYPDIPTI